MVRLKVVLVAVFMLLLGISIAHAVIISGEYELQRTGPEKEAIGVVEIEGVWPRYSDKFLEITVFRLKPNSIYSVWLIDKRHSERVPAGIPGKNHFKTDGSGIGRYVDLTDEYALDWNTLEIAYHADGDPSNTTGMVVVLTTKLYP